MSLTLGVCFAACSGGGSAGSEKDLLRPADRAVLAPGERDRLEALLPTTGPMPRLVGPDDPMPPVAAVRIVDERVDGLTLVRSSSQDHQAPSLQISGWSGLRTLILDGGWASITIDDLPVLEEVEVLAATSSAGMSIVRLGSLPRLERMLIQGADVEGLRGTWPALESLTIEHSNRRALRNLPSINAPVLRSVHLVGNGIEDVEVIPNADELRTLVLASNRIRSLEGLPDLPKLRRLELSDNPLDPEVAWPLERLPALRRLGLRRTGLRSLPVDLAAALENRADLQVDVDDALDPSGFAATLERLRQNFAATAHQRTEALPSNAGRTLERAGSCSWRTSTHRRAEVRCDIALQELDGTVAVRLGETDLVMPFSGGGAPRVRVEMSVEQGAAAIYLPIETDLIDLARTITSTDREEAERDRQPSDRFDGYAVAVAQPGQPAQTHGSVALLGSRVVFWISSDLGDLADDGKIARAVRITVRPSE